jgi:hypothetical protein
MLGRMVLADSASMIFAAAAAADAKVAVIT